MTVIILQAALRLHQAAEYCGLSVPIFEKVCPVKPIAFTESSRGNRYLTKRLDEWMDKLDPDQSEPSNVRRFGDKLNGKCETKGT